MHKTTYKIALAAALGLFAASCDDDKDKYVLSELSDTTIELESSDNIVISAAKLNSVILQFSYTSDAHEIYITNDSATTALADGVYILQASTSENFSTNVYTSDALDAIKGTNDITYTGIELNKLAISLGLNYDVASPLYFRLAHSYTAESLTTANFTTPIKVTVTPLYIDMHYCTIEGSKSILSNPDGELYRLISYEENGIYKGFIPTTSGWFQFWATDGIGQTWGNLGQDKSFAKVDLKSNSAWNFWTAEPAGCIYIELNVNTNYIIYNTISELNVSGDAAAAFNFDSKTCKWTATVNTEKDDASIRISGKTLSNDNKTGDASASARTGTIAFAEQGDSVIVSNEPSDLTIAKAGEYKVVLDLSHSKYTVQITNPEFCPMARPLLRCQLRMDTGHILFRSHRRQMHRNILRPLL